jgi:hypothetical protein
MSAFLRLGDAKCTPRPLLMRGRCHCCSRRAHARCTTGAAPRHFWRRPSTTRGYRIRYASSKVSTCRRLRCMHGRRRRGARRSGARGTLRWTVPLHPSLPPRPAACVRVAERAQTLTTDAARGVGVAPHPQRPPAAPTLWELRYAEAIDKPNGRHVKGLTRYLEFCARAVASFSCQWYTGATGECTPWEVGLKLGYGSKRRRESDQARMLKSYKVARPRLPTVPQPV